MTHPASCSDPRCTLGYRDHLVGIAVSADATPTRRPHTAANNAKDRVLDRDLDAYQRLRQSGVQPPHTDGSARAEKSATHRWEIESRPRQEGEP